MAYVVLLVVLAAVVLVIAAPLRRRPATPGPSAGEDPGAAELRELEAAREAKYREIRDAELDYRTGKLSDADFEATDRTLRAEAMAILRRLDLARERRAARYHRPDGDGPRDHSGVPGGDVDLPDSDALG
jgi:hypothetical protein